MDARLSRIALAGSPRHLELTKPIGVAKKDYLLLNISGSCNYNCKKCCNLVPHKRVLLSMPVIRKLITGAKRKLGVRTVVFVGEGETLLAPNFRAIISAVNKAGLYSILFTNGYFLDEALASFLAENNASIIFSIDSLKEKRYAELTGAKKSFKKVMRNIETSRRIFQKKIGMENGVKITCLAINMLLTNSSLQEVPAAREFCSSDILPVFNYPLMTGNATLHKKIFGNITKKVKKLASPTNLPTRENQCGYFFHGLTIGLDGSILACPYSLELTGRTVNITEIGIERAAELHDELISKFRKHDKKSYCIMRSPKYKEFLGEYRGAGK